MADPDTLARRLRRQEILSTAAALSGDPVLAPHGQAQLGRLSKARQAAKQVMPLGGGFYAQGGEIAQVPGWEEQEQRKSDRALKKALAVAESRRTTGFEDWYAKKQAELGMPTRSQATAAREFAAALPAFEGLATSLTQVGEIPGIPEAVARTMRSSPILGEEAAAGIERAGMSPEQVDWLSKGRRTEQELTRIESGMQVTGFELENLKKWSPWASGLSNRERIKRLENVHNAFGRKAASIMDKPWKDIEYTTEATKNPPYLRSEIPEGTRVIKDPETGQSIGVSPDGRMFELD